MTTHKKGECVWCQVIGEPKSKTVLPKFISNVGKMFLFLKVSFTKVDPHPQLCMKVTVSVVG